MWLSDNLTAIALGLVLASLFAMDVYAFYAVLTRRVVFRPFKGSLRQAWCDAEPRDRAAFTVGVCTLVVCAAGLPLAPLGHFRLHDLTHLAAQPWVWPSIVCAGIAGFIIGAMTWFVMLMRPGPRRPKQSYVLVVGNISVSAFLAFILLLTFWDPPADLLSSLETTLIICAVAVIYVLLAFGPRMAGIPTAVKIGLLLLIVSPIWQPMSTYNIIEKIRTERYAVEKRQTIFVAPISNARYDGLLLQTPDSLNFSQSALVQFFASRLSGKAAKDCLRPRLVAPGFNVDAVNTDPVEGTASQIAWEWMVSPKASGRQMVALDVLDSNDCSTTGDSHAHAQIAYGQMEFVWIFRPWFSPENLSEISSSATAVIGILTLITGLFGAKAATTEQRVNPKG